jgi:hypothetical protein
VGVGLWRRVRPAGAVRTGPGGTRYDPAIVTTDVTGCAQGSNKNTNRQNTLDSNQSAIDSTCNYTAKMNGTSASAPMVSGVAALVLEANPNLSYRDVKYILATTATRNHPNQPAVTLADGRTLVPGWTVNAAGRAYSNWYGFGVVNAARAVQVAENFQSLGALVDSGWRNTTRTVAIGNTSAAAARLTFQLANARATSKACSWASGSTTATRASCSSCWCRPAAPAAWCNRRSPRSVRARVARRATSPAGTCCPAMPSWMRMPRHLDAGSDRHGAGRDRCIAWQPRILQDPRSGALMMKTTILLSTLAFAAMTSPAWAQSSGQTPPARTLSTVDAQELKASATGRSFDVGGTRFQLSPRPR